MAQNFFHSFKNYLKFKQVESYTLAFTLCAKEKSEASFKIRAYMKGCVSGNLRFTDMCSHESGNLRFPDMN